ncbi:MAG TPA: hypothetical protein VMB50_24465 [Myxococcales bacterium]|nr:hypothetical protein [Myxococcales bacterium]
MAASRRRLPALLGGAACALALVALVLYLAGAFDSGHDARNPEAAQPATGAGTASEPAGGQLAHPRTDSGVAPIMAALDNYWQDIGRHQFAAAYGYYAPGATNENEQQFISRLEGEGVSSASFAGTVTASTGSADLIGRSFATVAVTSLVTHDAAHGCRRWSGTYTMFLEETGLWHIQGAALRAHPC